MSARPYFGIIESEWEIDVPNGSGGGVVEPQNGIPEDSVASAVPFQPYLIDSSRITLGEVHSYHIVRETTLHIHDGAVKAGSISTPQLVSQYRVQGSSNLYLRLEQYDSPEGATVYSRVAAGVTQKVRVGEFDGLLVHGHWQADYTGKVAHWKPTHATSVYWSIGNRVLSLYGEGIDDDSLLQVAESLAL